MTEQASWETAKAVYLTARRAELAYDAEHITPVIEESLARASQIPHHVWQESEQLTDVRGDAEDLLMAIPSPDAHAFAFKVQIAKAEGRETDGWDAMLLAEARRFAPDFLLSSDVEASHV